MTLIDDYLKNAPLSFACTAAVQGHLPESLEMLVGTKHILIAV